MLFKVQTNLQAITFSQCYPHYRDTREGIKPCCNCVHHFCLFSVFDYLEMCYIQLKFIIIIFKISIKSLTHSNSWVNMLKEHMLFHCAVHSLVALYPRSTSV